MALDLGCVQETEEISLREKEVRVEGPLRFSCLGY